MAGKLRWIALLAGIGAAIAPARAEAQERWRLDRASGQCALAREIAAPQPATVSIQTVPGSDSYRLLLVGKSVPPLPAGKFTSVTIHFQNADARFTAGARGTRLGGEKGALIVMEGMPPALIQALAHASSVSVEAKAATAGPFAFTDADKAAAALERCVADQLTAWGADPAQFLPGGAPPIALKDRDFWVPTDQLVAMLYDTSDVDAQLRVTIAADGRIDGCARLDQGAGRKVETLACTAVMGKPLFQPARDPAGKPVRGAASFPVKVVSRPG